MSIRLIARDLYQLMREVEKFEKQIEKIPYEKQFELKDRLRKMRAEKDRMRKVLDGCKDTG